MSELGGFWKLDSGESYSEDGAYEIGGEELEPLPDGVTVLGAIKDVKWAEYEGDEYINIQWQVLKPTEYKGRVLFQKLRVSDIDPKKQEKAMRMMYAIDSNSGGKLKGLEQSPNDMELMGAWSMKMMSLKVKKWEWKGKEGNWIAAVSNSKAKPEASKPQVQKAPETIADDIGF